MQDQKSSPTYCIVKTNTPIPSYIFGKKWVKWVHPTDFVVFYFVKRAIHIITSLQELFKIDEKTFFVLHCKLKNMKICKTLAKYFMVPQTT